MSIHLDLKQTKIIEPDSVFCVENEVTYAHGIVPEIFIHNTETEVFEHVATVYDLENYPDSRTEAIDEQSPYYRKATAFKEFETVQTAENFTEYTYNRVRALVNTYEQALESFEGIIHHSITSS